MSADVYARGVWLKDGVLTIKDRDLTVHLQYTAQIPGLSEVDLGEVDLDVNAYPPEIRFGAGDKRREMEGPEILELKNRVSTLHNVVVAAVRNALEGIA